MQLDLTLLSSPDQAVVDVVDAAAMMRQSVVWVVAELEPCPIQQWLPTMLA